MLNDGISLTTRAAGGDDDVPAGRFAVLAFVLARNDIPNIVVVGLAMVSRMYVPPLTGLHTARKVFLPMLRFAHSALRFGCLCFVVATIMDYGALSYALLTLPDGPLYA